MTKMSPMIYLDYAATTPVDPIVAETMQQYMTLDGIFGNAASNTHEFGFAAANAIEQARADIAALINAEPREIIFTSGGTESDNLALKGLMQFHCKNGKHIITSQTEHKAILDSCAALEKQGFDITYLKPQNDGLIALHAIESAIRPDTLLISIMHVNNETGVIQDIDAIAKLAKQHGIYFHTDAAQSFGKLPIDVRQTPVDLITMASHKIYGPKGIGALYVRHKPRVRLEEQISGGKHERSLRSGTLPTHQIAGFAAAAKLMHNNNPEEQATIAKLHTLFLSQLTELPGVSINGTADHKLANIINIRFAGVDNEALIASCTDLAFSSGSACTSATMAPSHVLQAMGLSNEDANSSVRISLGRFTTEADINTATTLIKQHVNRLRNISPCWELL